MKSILVAQTEHSLVFLFCFLFGLYLRHVSKESSAKKMVNRSIALWVKQCKRYHSRKYSRGC